MKEVKDLFSAQADSYAAYRPTYPQELYEFLYSITQHYDRVWDCATGNGQVAAVLAKQFAQVAATDISQAQLDKAIKADNITYRTCRAEQTPFEDHSFDLITVGTALHWFDFDAFYKEVNRVLKPGSPIVVWCYSLVRVNEEIDALLHQLYAGILHGYWDAERKYVDERYQTIPFPFEDIPVPPLTIQAQWTIDHMIGYLYSWSATQNYMRKNEEDPIARIAADLQKAWGTGEQQLVFPLSARAGRRA